STVPLFPITTFITPVFEGGAQGQPVPFTQFIQQPSITKMDMKRTLTIPDGHTVVLRGWKHRVPPPAVPPGPWKKPLAEATDMLDDLWDTANRVVADSSVPDAVDALAENFMDRLMSPVCTPDAGGTVAEALMVPLLWTQLLAVDARAEDFKALICTS